MELSDVVPISGIMFNFLLSKLNLSSLPTNYMEFSKARALPMLEHAPVQGVKINYAQLMEGDSMTSPNSSGSSETSPVNSSSPQENPIGNLEPCAIPRELPPVPNIVPLNFPPEITQQINLSTVFEDSFIMQDLKDLPNELLNIFDTEIPM